MMIGDIGSEILFSGIPLLLVRRAPCAHSRSNCFLLPLYHYGGRSPLWIDDGDNITPADALFAKSTSSPFSLKLLSR